MRLALEIRRQQVEDTWTLDALSRGSLLARCGSTEVITSSSADLSVSGGHRRALRPFREALASLESNGVDAMNESTPYSFDAADGSFLQRCPQLGVAPSPAIATPSAAAASSTPRSFERMRHCSWRGSSLRLTLIVGSVGSGLRLHRHLGGYNQLAYGAKRWTVFPENASVAGGWYPFRNHFLHPATY